MVRFLTLVLCLAGLLAPTGPAAAEERDTLRLELVLDPRETPPLEGEMILATIRGIYRETITNEELKLRSMTDFDWTRLGQDIWTDQRIDGRLARVFERRIAFFPKRAGALELLPIVHELEILDAGGKREIVLVRSAPVPIQVDDKPAGAGQGWLPVRALELSDSWDADAAQLEDGQSVRRRVVLRALGATPEMMPQQPPLRAPWLITFTPPAERNFQVTPQGPVTTLVWVWSLRPITGEPGVIPEVTIAYFDTETRAARTVTLAAAPIGYASFADNAASGWRKDPGAGWPHLAIFAGVTLLVAMLALRGRTGPSTALARLRKRLRKRQDLRRLRRHADNGDAESFRSLAQRLLEADPEGTSLDAHPILRPVDDMVFGEKNSGGKNSGGNNSGRNLNLQPVVRKVRHHVASTGR